MFDLDDIISRSTCAVAPPYFQLPVAGTEEPIYRERVYCYELYHQMRLLWPPDCQYSLGGEVDKAGHPLVRGHGLDGVKPDFLVHEPGNMGGNLAVIEVKPVTAPLDGVKKDIAVLCTFHAYADYQRCLLLIYGRGGFKALNRQVPKLLLASNCDIELWTHVSAGKPARRVVI